MDKSYRAGSKFDDESRERMTGLENVEEASPTWRGWVLGIFFCALLAAIIPYIDFIIRCTRLTLNLLPASSMIILMVLILGFNLGLGRFAGWLKLTRQDLVLIFCMTMIMNAVPGSGFMNYLINGQVGLSYYASPENNFRGVLFPNLPAELTVRDPEDPHAAGPRPAEWFYSGLPNTNDRMSQLRSAFGMLAPPFVRWCVVLAFVVGMFFALSALLFRQWSDRERLPFPLAQVPQTMLGGLFGQTSEKPFMLDKVAWLGIAITFFLHSYNAFGNYASHWAPISMRNDMATYLTEAPWRYLQPLYCNIFPSVIAFMYLVSLEVSFSLWFFYLIILKLGIVIACGVFGLGENGWYFNGSDGTQGIFTNQGSGALVMMVLAGFYMARLPLWQSMRQALGLSARDAQETFSPRTLWMVLIIGLFGTLAWFVWYGVNWYWALILVVVLLIGATGVARLVSEGGMLFVKGPNPSLLLHSVFTPADLGSHNYPLVTLSTKVFQFDDFRMNPMINVMGALHLGSLMRVRLRPLMAGLATALVVAFAVCFFSYYLTCFLTPGGARNLGWAHGTWAPGFYKDMASKVKSIDAYEKRKAELQATGTPMPASEKPLTAKTDWDKVTWLGIGGAMMGLFLFLRTRLFWWPHPVGYVMWLNMQPIYSMWFSYFLGWLIKSLILKFGGMRMYASGRRFFVGLVIGEALATIVWIIVAYFTGLTGGYAIEYN